MRCSFLILLHLILVMKKWLFEYLPSLSTAEYLQMQLRFCRLLQPFLSSLSLFLLHFQLMDEQKKQYLTLSCSLSRLLPSTYSLPAQQLYAAGAQSSCCPSGLAHLRAHLFFAAPYLLMQQQKQHLELVGRRGWAGTQAGSSLREVVAACLSAKLAYYY